MSEGKREPERAEATAQAAQDVALQGLRTEVSDFQDKPLAPRGTPRDAFSTSSRAKTEPAVTKIGLNGAAPIRAVPQ